MSEERNFDDHIKNEFKNYSPKVAPHIWDNIVAERKKRKPVGFWFNVFSGANLIWLIAFLVAGSVGAGLAISHSSLTTGKSTNNPSLTTVSNNPIADNKLAATKNNDSENPGSSSSVQNNTRNQTKNVTTVQATSFAKNNSINKKTALFKKSNYTYKSRSVINNKTSTDVYDLSDKESAAGEDVVITGVSQDLYMPGTTTKKGFYSVRLTDRIDKLLLNPSIANVFLQKRNYSLPECPTIEKDAAANKKYFEIYIAPDYAVRTLTDTANSVYLQKRKESTKFSSAFSAGIRYTKVFNNGVSIRAGLNYSQINETFSYVQGNVVQVTYIIDAAGDTTGSYTVRGTRYKTTYNHYRSIDIPITIGYELGNGRLHANINAGVIANIYSWQQGDELDTNLQPVNITTGEGSAFYQFRTNVGLGLTGGASFYYKLTDQLHFLAEPYIRYNLQPMSTGTLTLQQKYTTIGLRLGLRLDLPDGGNVIKR